MKVAMITEGTYPYVHGGVSMWCDRLMRKLPDVEFALYAISPAPDSAPVWDLPPNVVSLEAIEIEPSTGRKFERYSKDVKQHFLEAFDSFLVATLREPTPHEAEFTASLRSLFEACADIPVEVGVRSAAAFDLVRDRWMRRSVGDRLDDMGKPSLHDVLDVTSSLSRFLMPLSVVPNGDIAHTTANGLSSLSAMAAYWTHGTPLLLTEHGVYLRERYLEAQKSDENARVNAFHLQFFRRLNDATLQIADLVSPVSNYNRRWEIETGADDDRIRTIYNGVEPALFPPIDTEPDVPTVSWIGRIDPLKDLVTLIEAFARVRDAIPEAKLRLFGPVPEGNEEYNAECLETIEAYGLEGAVVFEGLISRVAAAHEAGHVVALSSISEGFPFTVLEAMMSGRATVSTDVGGVAEAVDDCGLLVSPRSPDEMGEAMIRLLKDDALRRELGRSARERALALFTLDEMSGQYLEVYESLIARPSEEAWSGLMTFAHPAADGAA